jgi:thiol-disulfide isomerase/thioredoxin
MKRLVPTLLLGFLAACSSGQESAPDAPFEAHRGQWVLVNYWAQWCKPCIEEIPELNRVHEEHPDITVFGVNYDGLTGEALGEQESRLGIRFKTLTDDPSAALGIRRPAVLPTTLVINPEGALVQTLLGPQNEQSLLAATQSQPASEP